MNYRRTIPTASLAAILALAAVALLARAQTPAAQTGSSSEVHDTAQPERHYQHWGPLGVFEDTKDIGTVLHPGATDYRGMTDAAHNYTLTASGENIWGTTDAFRFAYKKESGDVDLTADISFVGAGTNPHRKAVLMIRQSLDANSPYVDAALHGSGLLSLQ